MILKLTSSFLFFFSVLVIGGTGCQSEEPAAPAETVTSSAATEAAFVGCRPSAGECANSCPDRKGRFLVPDARCTPDDPTERGACVCGGSTTEPAEPPPGQFAGCYPSPSECRAACNGKGGGYIRPHEQCPGGTDGACFCNGGGGVQ